MKGTIKGRKGGNNQREETIKGKDHKETVGFLKREGS